MDCRSRPVLFWLLVISYFFRDASLSRCENERQIINKTFLFCILGVLQIMWQQNERGFCIMGFSKRVADLNVWGGQKQIQLISSVEGRQKAPWACVWRDYSARESGNISITNFRGVIVLKTLPINKVTNFWQAAVEIDKTLHLPRNRTNQHWPTAPRVADVANEWCIMAWLEVKTKWRLFRLSLEANLERSGGDSNLEHAPNTAQLRSCS